MAKATHRNFSLDACVMDPSFDNDDCEVMWLRSISTLGYITPDPLAWGDHQTAFIPVCRRVDIEPDLEPEPEPDEPDPLLVARLKAAADEDARNMAALERRLAAINRGNNG